MWGRQGFRINRKKLQKKKSKGDGPVTLINIPKRVTLCFHWIMFTEQMMFTQKHNVCRLLCSSAQRVPIMPLGGHICTRPIIIYPPAAPTKHQTVITIIKTRNSHALHHHHRHKDCKRKNKNKSSLKLPHLNHTSQVPRPSCWWNFHSGSGNLTKSIPTTTQKSYCDWKPKQQYQQLSFKARQQRNQQWQKESSTCTNEHTNVVEHLGN